MAHYKQGGLIPAGEITH